MTKTRIMIVEDEWIIANDIKDSLIEQGYMVSALVSSGKEAITKAAEDNPDLVLMDIMLHGEVDGIEAASLIQKRFNIPVVFLTAYSNQYLVDRAKGIEHYGYLLKPFKDKELHIAIDMALHNHKLRQQVQEKS